MLAPFLKVIFTDGHQLAHNMDLYILYFFIFCFFVEDVQLPERGSELGVEMVFDIVV